MKLQFGTKKVGRLYSNIPHAVYWLEYCILVILVSSCRVLCLVSDKNCSKEFFMLFHAFFKFVLYCQIILFISVFSLIIDSIKMSDFTDELLENENLEETTDERYQSQSNGTSQGIINSTKYKHVSDVKCTVQNIQLNCYQIIILSFRRFQSGLYFTFFSSTLFPTFYKTVRVYYLGNLPDAAGVDIASQLIWVSLVFEIFQETLIQPLFHLIGQTFHDLRETKNRIKIGCIIIFLIHLSLSIIVYLLATPLTHAMAQKSSAINLTVNYVRLELFSVTLEGVNQFYVVVLTMFSWQKHLYIILILRMAILIVLDTFFLSQSSYSLQLGVKGIAYGNIAASSVIFIYCSITVAKALELKSEDLFTKATYSFQWLECWLRIGFFSGLDSFIRNIFYILCIIRVMNVIEEQGVYWRANAFIYQWLLLPYTPLLNVLKQDSGKDTVGIDHKQKMTSYVIISSLIFMCLGFSIPLWKHFIKFVLNVRNEADVSMIYNVVLYLGIPYGFFMFGQLLDAVLYGKGKTEYLALKSILGNLLIYLPMFICFITNVYEPSLRSVALIFGGGLTFSFLTSVFCYLRLIKLLDFKI